MNEIALKTALKECVTSAKIGDHLAKDAHFELKKAIANASKEVRDSLAQFDKSRINYAVSEQALNEQLMEISENLEALPSQIEADIKSMEKSMSSFSIVLFGRTMAGKSTFMEILTRGNGDSIGKGAQRTTLDVRTYEWNGLKITDVPGIAAFGGEDDEKTAFEAAKSADLIVFLLTDDAPQASEAECLARICNLGKPVLGLINVKIDIDTNKLKFTAHDFARKFNSKRLETIKNHFLSFAEKYEQNWGGIRFEYVHLKAAYMSQMLDNVEHSEELYQLSKFAVIEDFITQEVIKCGKFYRIKNFVDSLGRPLLETMKKLLDQGAINSEHGRLLVGKRRKLSVWTKNFEVTAKEQIESLLSKIKNDLMGEIAVFTEDNYNNTKAAAEWDKILKGKKIPEQCDQVLKALSIECDEEIKEITREIGQEASFNERVFADNSINMSKVTNGKRIWKWGTSIITAGISIAALFTPIGWAIPCSAEIVSWVGSFFFDDYEKQKLDARRRLEKKLSESINKKAADLEKHMKNSLYNNIIRGKLKTTLNGMTSLINSLFKLSEAQKKLGWGLNWKLREINKELVDEALDFLGAKGMEWHIRDLARIPGNAVMIVLDDGKVFPNDIRKKLKKLLQEEIYFVFHTENTKILLSRAIGRGCQRDNISIEQKWKIAHIPVQNFDGRTRLRMRLAQQLTELLITK